MKLDTAKIAEYETYTLKSLKVAFAKRFGAAALAKTRVEFQYGLDHLTDEVRVQIETKIFGQQMPQEYMVSMLVPKNWWQHLVDDHFPYWWKQRWPVKHKEVYRNVMFNHWALLPKFDKIPPGEEIIMFTEPYFDEAETPKDT